MSGAQIASEVAAALREAGEPVSVTPSQIGGTPWEAPTPAPSPITVFARVDVFRVNEIDGARVLSGDKKILIEVFVPAPKPGDAITVRGVGHRIEGVREENFQGTPVMYECQCRIT